MPREATGQYRLPTPINPVKSLDTIASNWANPTMDDIAVALTDSLSRTGLGGMSVAFKIADGTVGAPGLAFTSEPSLGLYKPINGTLGFVVGGAEIARYHAGAWTFNIQTSTYGWMSIKNAGTQSFTIHNSVSGTLYLAPSNTVNGEDWNYGKGLFIRASDGHVNALNNFQVDGVFQAAGTSNLVGAANCNSTLVVQGGFQGVAPSSFLSTLNIAGNLTVSGGANSIAGNTAMGVVNAQGLNAAVDVSAGRDVIASQEMRARRFTPTVYFQNGVSGTVVADYPSAQSQVIYLSAAATIYPQGIPQGAMLRLLVVHQGFGFGVANVVWPATGVPPTLASGPYQRTLLTITNDGLGVMLINGVGY